MPSIWNQLMTSDDQARFRRYAASKSFYKGLQWPSSNPRRERRITLNYTEKVIDRVAQSLMMNRSFVVDGGAEKAQLRTEQALAEVAEYNDLDALDFECELSAAIKGDGAYKVTWDPILSRVVVRAPNVAELLAWSDQNDILKVVGVATRHQVSAATAQATYGVSIREKMTDVVEEWTEETFNVYLGDALVVSGLNPYGFIPFAIFPNVRRVDEFWGSSDVDAVTESQNELNRAFTQISRIVELSGNPIAVLENVDRSEDIAVGPGAIWELPEKSKAYLLDLMKDGGTGFLLKYVEAIYKSLYDLGETPRTSFGDSAGGNDRSGVALEIDLQPLIQRVWRKRLIRSGVYRRRAQMILRLLTRFTGAKFVGVPRVAWGSVTPRDMSRAIDDARLLVAAGLKSHKLAMGEFGVADPKGEFSLWLEESKDIVAAGGPSPVQSSNQTLSRRQ